MAVTLPSEEWRTAMCEWLTANNINIMSVPIDSPFAIAEEPDGQRLIRYTEYVLTDDGRKQIDPEDPELAWLRSASAPCTVEPPAWLNVEGGRP